MSQAVNDGIRINYEIIGSGPPLVLQHGLFWSLEGWKRVGYVDALKQDYQLILIDARGHGKSDKPHDSSFYKLDSLIADVTSVLDDAGVARAHFWGFSMGGFYAYGMAAQAPNRLRSLIIGAAHPFARSLPRGSRPPGDDPDEFIDVFFKRLGLDQEKMSLEEFAEFYDNDFQALSASLVDRPALDSAFRQLKVPCLFYAGDKDGVHDSLLKFAATVGHAELIILSGLNHPEAFYRSDLILPAAQDFLGRAEASNVFGSDVT